MNSKIIGIVIFVLGAASGVGCTYKFFKNKYEGYADEEIESVKDMARRQIEAMSKSNVEEIIEENRYGGDPVGEKGTPGNLTDEESIVGFSDVCAKKDTDEPIYTSKPFEQLKAEMAADTRTHAQKSADFNRELKERGLSTKPDYDNAEYYFKSEKEEKASIARRTKSKSAVAYNKIAHNYNRDSNFKKGSPIKEDEEEVDEADIDQAQLDQEAEDEYNAADEEQKAEDEEDDIDRLMGMQTSSNQNPQPPYIISPDQFVKECKSYDKVTLTYYNKDSVLLDEDDTVIDDVETVIGRSCLTSFGAMNDDPNLVYIRNERYDIDYEVLRKDASYSIDHLGWGL